MKCLVLTLRVSGARPITKVCYLAAAIMGFWPPLTVGAVGRDQDSCMCFRVFPRAFDLSSVTSDIFTPCANRRQSTSRCSGTG
jgi:hypothetical protein